MSLSMRCARRVSFLLVVFLMLPSAFIITKGRIELDRQFDQHFNGFRSLSLVEYASLVSDHTEVPVPLEISRGSRVNEWQIHFSLPEKSAVYFSVSAGSSETVFVHPLILEKQDKHQFLLPLIRSSIPERRIWNSINPGWFDAGDHTLRLFQDESVSRPMPDSLQLMATRPSYDSDLAYFIDHSPVIQIRNSANVLDDIPLIGFGEIAKRESSYKVKFHVIFSSENGGTMPMMLMADTSRTLDIEWVLEQIYDASDGNLEASQRRFQKCSHGDEKFEGEEAIRDRPVLVVATPNNNFSDGSLNFGSMGIPCPSGNGDQTPIYYAPKPRFLAPQEWWWHILAENPEMQEWSYRELAMEGCVKLADKTDPKVKDFMAELQLIRQDLQVTFPDRGCDSQLLQLPNDSSR